MVPDWYYAMAVAEKLRCKPFEMDDVPLIWQYWAGAALEAEGIVREHQARDRAR